LLEGGKRQRGKRGGKGRDRLKVNFKKKGGGGGGGKWIEKMWLRIGTSRGLL